MLNKHHNWLLTDGNILDEDLDDDLDNILFDNVLARSKNPRFRQIVQGIKSGIRISKITHDRHLNNLTPLEKEYIYNLRQALTGGMFENDDPTCSNNKASLDLLKDSDRKRFLTDNAAIKNEATLGDSHFGQCTINYINYMYKTTGQERLERARRHNGILTEPKPVCHDHIIQLYNNGHEFDQIKISTKLKEISEKKEIWREYMRVMETMNGGYRKKYPRSTR